MKYYFLFLTLVLTSTVKAETDRCVPILANGCFDTITHIENSASKDEQNNFYCSKDFESYANQRASSGSFGFSYQGIGFKFGNSGNNSSEFSKLREVCQNSYSNVSREDYKNFVSKIASKPILDAYLECIKLTSSQEIITVSFEDFDNIVSFSLKFKGVTGLPNPTITKVIVGGSSLKCTWDSFTVGTPITIEGISDYCERIGNENALVIFKTTLGDYKITVTKKVAPPVNPIKATYSLNLTYTEETVTKLPPLVTTQELAFATMPRRGPTVPATGQFIIPSASGIVLGNTIITSCMYKNPNGIPKDWTKCYQNPTPYSIKFTKSGPSVMGSYTNNHPAYFQLNLATEQIKKTSTTKTVNNADVDVMSDTFSVTMPLTTTKGFLKINITKLNKTFNLDVTSLRSSEFFNVEKVDITSNGRVVTIKLL